MLDLAARFAGQVTLDIGTGDGAFVYRSALADPATLFIGIDANPKPLRKISIKAERKLTRDGVPNALFVQAAAEDLPSELSGIAGSVHINFPWGSLLRSVLLPEEEFLSTLRNLMSPEGGELAIVTGIDPARDRSQLERLGLRAPDPSALRARLFPAYAASGFGEARLESLEREEILSLGTAWARKLAGGSSRRVFRMRFRA